MESRECRAYGATMSSRNALAQDQQRRHVELALAELGNVIDTLGDKDLTRSKLKERLVGIFARLSESLPATPGTKARSGKAETEPPEQHRRPMKAEDQQALVLPAPGAPSSRAVASRVPARPRVTSMLSTQQRVASKAPETHQVVKIKAGAGSGKTTVLVAVSERLSGRGLYMAYNKDIQRDAEQRFSKTVAVRTGHALAHAAVAGEFRSAGKQIRDLNLPEVREILGIGPDELWLATAARATLGAWLVTTDDRVLPEHIPDNLRQQLKRRARMQSPLQGDITAGLGEVATRITESAGKLWDACRDTSSAVPISHDGYFRVWVERKPKLLADYILVDEAQDMTPIVRHLLQQQTERLVVVGDHWQSIYQYRGAVDALRHIQGFECSLTESYRFGQAIADAANAVLKLHGEKDLLVGVGKAPGKVGNIDPSKPFASLSRTNVGLCLMAARLAPKAKTAIVGGAREILELMESAYGLFTCKSELVKHPTLKLFQDFRALERYVDDTGDAECAMLVKMLNEHGAALAGVIEILKGDLVPEPQAHVVLSTVHKAKGREWEQVMLDEDFKDLYDHNQLLRVDEANLLYVAATRAKSVLQPNSTLRALMDGKHGARNVAYPTARAGLAAAR